ncbi:MAG: CRISPR-associated helicase Cas3' [Sarcina sp.]
MKKYLSRPNEFYEEHIERCLNSYSILCKEEIISNMVRKLAYNEQITQYEQFILKAAKDVIGLHDEGKKNPNFQSYIGNEDFKNYEYNKLNKEHSIISVYYYLEKYHKEIELLTSDRKIKKVLKEIIMVFAMIIKSHHGELDIYNKANILGNISEKFNDYPEMFFAGYNNEAIKYYKKSIYLFKDNIIYLLSKYLFSVLVTCDFMAVHEFKEDEPLKINNIDKIKKNVFESKLNENPIIQNIRLFEKGILSIEGVNKYRSEMFLEAENNIIKYKDSLMYYLEAPTGCGKSLTGLNLTLNMVDDVYNKIIYVAPFSNIIEQTYHDIKKFIGTENKDVVNVSCKEEIVTGEVGIDESYDDYSTDNMDRLLLNYPFTVISHIRLFDALLGYKRKHCMMTTLMSNSIIVLDEIQSYKNALWIPLINLLKEVAENLNIKIVIMSATLPKLDVLLDDKTFEVKSLINRKEYYYDFFKTRCKPDFSLLGKYTDDIEEMKKIVTNKILDIAKEHNRLLVGTITRKTCEAIYQDLRRAEIKDCEIFKIDSSTSLINKKYIIDKIKENNIDKKIILVATQTVEAGVDIDMEIGFKNIGILDSDEQFAGRIQRNFKGKGIVYYFKIDEVGKIYRGDYRAEKTLVDRDWQEILEDKTFEKFYQKCYSRLINDKENLNEEIESMKVGLKFKEIYKAMKLIDDQNKINLLMLGKLKVKDKIIDLNEELKKYKKIKSSNMDYSKKEVELSRFKKIFDMFTYTISVFDEGKVSVCGEFGSYKLVDNAEEYYTNLEDGYLTEKSEIVLEKLFEEELIY